MKLEDLRVEFNKRFAAGEQYIEIVLKYNENTNLDDEIDYEIKETAKNYIWEQRAVYNKILPIIEYFEFKYKSLFSEHVWDYIIYGENGLVENLIPLQREYNNIKNYKSNFLNRCNFGNVFVEDGSVDMDDLAEEGVTPGKIITYRQGSLAPTIPPVDKDIYLIYNEELNNLNREIEAAADHFLRCRIENNKGKHEENIE